MRTTKELKDALMRLGQLPDTPERKAQQEVIRFRQTEKTVFTNHVMKVPESERNESVFYAARDAAQFVAGKIGLDVLLGTDVPEPDSTPEDDTETVTVTKGWLKKMERRIERLEALLLKREHLQQQKEERFADKDFLIQAEACDYIGCAQCTIMRWTRKGIVKAVQRGRFLFYDKKELDANPIIQEYKKRGKRP